MDSESFFPGPRCCAGKQDIGLLASVLLCNGDKEKYPGSALVGGKRTALLLATDCQTAAAVVHILRLDAVIFSCSSGCYSIPPCINARAKADTRGGV